MRIIIDVQGMQSHSNRNRGIGRYTYAFTKYFIELAKDHEIFLLLNGKFPETVKSIIKEFKTFLSIDRFLIFDVVGSGMEINQENEKDIKISEFLREKLIEDIAPDLLIITSLFEGLKDNCIVSVDAYSKHIPTAVIFYDLIPYMRPNQFLVTHEIKMWYMRKLNFLKNADILLAISHSAEHEAAIFLGHEHFKLKTISSATDDNFNPKYITHELIEKYNITQPYLMHTSAYEPRKNFKGLIRAFSLLSLFLQKQYQLVLVCGLTEENRKDLEIFAKKVGLSKNKLVLTGFVPDKDLITLYSQATLFVFPSIHEGFGLPVLEAMSCGTATIGSATSSIPEVIGRVDALFDPLNPQSITNKITEVLTNKDFLISLENHAIQQAKKFSWENTAQKALDFIEEQYSHLTKQKKKRKEVDLTESTRLLMEKIEKLQHQSTFKEKELQSIQKTVANNEKTIISQIAYGNLPIKLKWRIEGPFDSSYSLALLNRETALALDKLGVDVALHSTEGPGDFDPDPSFLSQHPRLAKLHQKALKTNVSDAHICSRNLYPPRVTDMHSHINMLHHYAWEESGFPQGWIEDFNHSLDGMTCLSSHVEKIMIDNGVSVLLSISGCGVDHWERIISDKHYLIEAKGFKFLHVSSCFPRKGADVLLKAYGDTFTSNDNVTLIIKTFPNPHNEVYHWLKEAKQEHIDYPDVMIIEDDLSEAQLKSLYEQCHILVAPSRAEGFGLPMAEAMLSGLAVITTAWGGQLDFCTNETAWLIDYDFVPAQTHFELFNSVWAEPSRKELARTMEEVYQLPENIRREKAKKGRDLLLKNFTWEKTAENLLNFVKTLPEKSILSKKPKIGWITSWNTQCGIASYSKHLIDAMSQEVEILAAHTDSLLEVKKENVSRCWYAGDGNKLNALEEKIDALELNTLVIQFNYSFYDFEHFPSFIHKQCEKGRTVVVMVHSTSDAPSTPHKKLFMLTSALERCDRILVHTPNDLNRLKALGLTQNTALFPHGIPDWKPTEKEVTHTFTLATYGFFLPHKGLLEIIDTIDLLKKKGVPLKLKMVNAEYPVPQSAELICEAKKKIETLKLTQEISLMTEYFPDEVCLEELSKADLIVFPYQETGESSSAAVRYGIAAGSPVAVTPLKIFDNVAPAVFKLSGTETKAMAASLKQIITQIEKNSEMILEKSEQRQRWSQTHRYSNLGQKLNHILMALHHKKTQWSPV